MHLEKNRRSLIKDKDYLCLRPWHPDKGEHVQKGKRDNMIDFYYFFEMNAIAIAEGVQPASMSQLTDNYEAQPKKVTPKKGGD